MKRFAIKPTIYFGENALNVLTNLTGTNALIITDKMMGQFGFVNNITNKLTQLDICYQIFDDIIPDPDISTIVKGMKEMDQCYPDIVIALGGGSVIDAAKAIIYSLLCFNNNRGSNKPKPYFVAIPTTSGTGSEVTSFSVIKSNSEKLVIVDDQLLPDIAILDPFFVKSIPPKITADTGMDVLCHALEAYVSKNANDFTDALAEKTTQLVFNYLIECYRDGTNHIAREKMHNASCIAGMSFTNASLGITHSLAHALGGIFGLPHGRANALLLPYVVEFNTDFNGACNNNTAQKYAELARILGLPCHSVREGVCSIITAINVLKEELCIPRGISDVGITEYEFNQRLDMLVHQALHDSCTPTNPRNVSEYDLKNLYRYAFIGK